MKACAQLVDDLSRACPHLRVLATSREPLGLVGEVAWSVPVFSLPPPAAPTGPASHPNADQGDEGLLHFDAVRLFVDRADAALPAFMLTEQNARAVAEICRRLDGIPLAIELAAARVRGLSVEAIAARLDDRFRLLTSGGRTALPRQQTLRATLDWSYDLLTLAEQALFARLSVFAGSFTLAAAEAVCADDPVVRLASQHSRAGGVGVEVQIAGSSEPDGPQSASTRASPAGHAAGDPVLEDHNVLDVLLRLVDKSLVVREGDVSEASEARSGERQAGRYRLLETLREYGRERLAGRGAAEEHGVRCRHLQYYLGLVERAAGEAGVGAQPLSAPAAGADRLDDGRDNLRAALKWAHDRGDAALSDEISGVLARLAERLASLAVRHALTPLVFELRRLKLPAYAELECALLRQTDLSILSAGADLYHVIGDWAAELAVLQQYMQTQDDDEVAVARVRVRCAHLLMLRNDARQALDVLADVARTASTHRDQPLLLDALLEQGHGYDHLADCHQGRRAYAEALALLEHLRPRLSGEAYRAKRLLALRGSGNAAHNADDNEVGMAHHAAALALAQELGDAPEEALAWINVADMHWGCWRYGEALTAYERARVLANETCHALAGGLALLGRGIVLWSIGRYAAAADLLEQGLEIARELGNGWWIAYGLTYLGNVRASSGDCIGALRLSREAIEVVRGPGIGYPLFLARTYALWQQEVLAPGLPEHRLEIEAALAETQRLGLNGLALSLTWVRLLHRVADLALSDAAVEEELASGVSALRSHPPVKGASELLGLQVVHGLRTHRPSVDPGALEQAIRSVCEQKASFLEHGYQEGYWETRRCWEAKR